MRASAPRGRRLTALIAALACVASLIAPTQVEAATRARSHGVWSPPQTPLPKTPSVPGTDYVNHPATHPKIPGYTPKASAWPAAGGAGLTVAGIAPSRVHAAIADQKAATAAGVHGVLFSVDRNDGTQTAGRASVTLDYSQFADAFGGNYAQRLRLVALPACALTTPSVPACRVQRPVAFTNDPVSKTLTAGVDLPGAATGKPASSVRPMAQNTAAAAPMVVMAATSAPAGSTGTYTATSLKGSDQWSAGGSSGTFSYSYPITVPATLGGGAPQVALSYDSGGIDGETVSANAQASWVGDGWSYDPGFIERSYKPCNKDGITGSGDLCWPGGDTTLSLSLAGHSGEIVKDDTTGAFKLSDDDGTTITKLSGAANGTANGEAFLVTTPDGVKYYFGLGHLPGTTSGAATNSVYTEPVYSPNSNDPCYSASTGQASWCQMGWRFGLDAVVDPKGNLIQYSYTPETNYYNRGGGQGTGTLTQYVRGGYLNTISYGWLLSDAVAGAQPASQVLFGVTERCLTSSSVCQYSNLSSSTASNWPDVPYDQNCGSSGTCANVSPTFWSTKMLATISTQVLIGSAYQSVDTYTLTHQFPANGDGTTPNLWLANIVHSATNGQPSASLPPVVFYGTALANRVPGAFLNGSQLPALYHWRIKTIDTETGAAITAAYSSPACSQSNPVNLPSSQDSNTMLCYPQYWAPPNGALLQDWFEKYLVTSVTVNDLVTGTPARVTSYTYVGNPAWHSDDSELTDPSQRTWSQWRGYGQVITNTGGGTDPITQTEATYLRGMNGDITLSGGTRTVNVTDSQGGVHSDDNALDSFALETQTFTNAGGSVVADQIDTPSETVTATHIRISPLPKQLAVMPDTAKKVTRDLLANGTWRTREVDYTYDPAHANRLTETDDKGTGEASVPELCTDTFYASSAINPQMLDFVSETRTISAPCGTNPSAANTVGDALTGYDNNPPVQAANLDNGGTALGEPTSTAILDHYTTATPPVPQYVTTSTATYDVYGRQLSKTDPNATDATHPSGATTATSYTPATKALATQISVTNPLGFITTTTQDPARSLPTHKVDANNNVTDATYDQFGRIIAAWLTIHPKAANPSTPSLKFAYSLGGSSSPSWSQTQTLHEDLSYGSSYTILNGFGQTRQTQSDAADDSATRNITDTFYDSHGWIVKSSGPYNSPSAASSTILVTNDNAVPDQTLTAFDGQGRATSSTSYSYANAQWSTTIAYPGADRTDITPPTGTAPSSTFTDGRGQTVQGWRYKTATATGNAADADVTRYTYTPGGKLATIVDPTNATSWSYTYDLRGRQIENTDPDSGTTVTGYDGDSRIGTVTDGRGQALSFGYDLLGRKTGEYSGTSTGNPANLLASWTYDTLAKGLPTSSTRYVGGASGAAYTSAVTGYTANGSPTGSTVNIPAVEGSLAGSYTANLTYSPNTGLLDETDLPAAGDLGAESLLYGYQRFGLLMSVGGNSTYLAGVVYDAFGKPLKTTLGDMPLQGVQTIAYDGATQRPLSVTVDKENSATHTDVTSYTYDAAGQITSARDAQNSGAVDFQCYGYDYAGRLTTAWTDTGMVTTAASPPSIADIGGCANGTPTSTSAKTQIGGPAPYWQTYSYDATGNRTAEVDHNTAGTISADVTRTYHYPAAGASTQPHTLTSTTLTGGTTGTDSYTYDTAGNTATRKLTTGVDQTLTWDAEGRLGSVKNNVNGQTSNYLYDANGALLLQKDPTETVLYLNGQEIHHNTATGTTTALRSISAPGGPSVVETASDLSYKFANLQNTGDVTIDGLNLSVTRRYFDPYGRTRGAAPGSWPDEHGFLDKPQDASSGLTMVGARAYDSGSGRFESRDPVLETGDPNQIGGYAYAGDDPVSASDPTGLSAIDALCDGAAGCTKSTLGVNPDAGGSPGADTEAAPRTADPTCADWYHFNGHFCAPDGVTRDPSTGIVTDPNQCTVISNDGDHHCIYTEKTEPDSFRTEMCGQIIDGMCAINDPADYPPASSQPQGGDHSLDGLANILHWAGYIPGLGTFASLYAIEIDALRGDPGSIVGDLFGLIPFGKELKDWKETFKIGKPLLHDMKEFTDWSIRGVFSLMTSVFEPSGNAYAPPAPPLPGPPPGPEQVGSPVTPSVVALPASPSGPVLDSKWACVMSPLPPTPMPTS